MKSTSTKRLKRTLKVSAIALLCCHSIAASADYRVAAFSESRGFVSLMKGDLSAADKSLGRMNLRAMSYGDANNLCVLQLLTKRYDESVATCRASLRKLNQSSLRPKVRKAMAAEIYTNLAIAQHKQGDLFGSRASLDKAIKQTTKSGNAESNAIVLSSSQLAGS